MGVLASRKWENTRGVRSRTAKLTVDDVRSIAQRRGERVAELVKEFGVCPATIYKIWRRDTYRDETAGMQDGRATEV